MAFPTCKELFKLVCGIASFCFVLDRISHITDENIHTETNFQKIGTSIISATRGGFHQFDTISNHNEEDRAKDNCCQ